MDQIDYLAAVTKRFLAIVDEKIGRKDSGKLTAKAIATSLGMLPQNLNRLRTGTHNVTLDACCRLVALYDADATQLITGHPAKNADIKQLTIQLIAQRKSIDLLLKQLSAKKAVNKSAKITPLKPPKHSTSKAIRAKQRS